MAGNMFPLCSSNSIFTKLFEGLEVADAVGIFCDHCRSLTGWMTTTPALAMCRVDARSHLSQGSFHPTASPCPLPAWRSNVWWASLLQSYCTAPGSLAYGAWQWMGQVYCGAGECNHVHDQQWRNSPVTWTQSSFLRLQGCILLCWNKLCVCSVKLQRFPSNNKHAPDQPWVRNERRGMQSDFRLVCLSLGHNWI